MRRKIILLLSLTILLAGCYQTVQTQVRLSDFGYQFREPEGLCRKRALPEGVALYCPEGQLIINFPLVSEAGSVEDAIAAHLGENDDLYTLSKWEALGPELTVAELPSEIHLGNESLPKYVAAKQFGPDRLAVIEAVLYTGAFESDFERSFRTVVTMLQPYGPEDAPEE